MSSITLKISSLVIRTLSKPIANQIKQQAREHARFRNLCVSFAQRLHRLDMRLRLGLLQDAAAIDRQAAREAAEAQAKKHKHDAATVKTEARTKAEEIIGKEKSKAEKADEKAKAKIRIRPLSEAKAIDSGANFISEAFLFLVGAGLIVSESLRSRRKENTRREDVAEKLEIIVQSERDSRKALISLEKEILALKAEAHPGNGKAPHIIPKEVWSLEEDDELVEVGKSQGWPGWLRSVMTSPGSKSSSKGESSQVDKSKTS